MKADKISFAELLTDLGLSSQAAQTYLALLDLESVSIRRVAAATGINRGTTYDAIKQLVTIGLVSMIQRGKQSYYTAESPEKIYDLIRDRRKQLVELTKQADVAVPSLLAKSVRPEGRPIVRYYQDDEGVVTILKDVLQTCAKLKNPEYYAYSSKPLRQYLYRKFPHFTTQRINEGVNVKVIAIGEGGDPAAASERKWLAEPAGGNISSYTIIYGNKVAIISISSDYTPYGIVVEDKGAAQMQRLLFDQLWSTL